MFDVPIDAWYAWIGLSLASAVVFGAAGSLPTTPPPDAGDAAETVDRIAAAEYDSTAEHPLDAAAIRIGARGIALRNDAGTAGATFAWPVTPVADGSTLASVARGTPPEEAFDSPRAFKQAIIEARAAEPTWRPADRTLLVRRTSWGGVDVTLVDA